MKSLSFSFAIAFFVGLFALSSNAEAYKYELRIKNTYKWSIKIKKIKLYRIGPGTTIGSLSANKTIDKCVGGINCYKSWQFRTSKKAKYKYSIKYQCQTKLFGKWKSYSFHTKKINSDSSDSDSTTFVTIKKCKSSNNYGCSADTDGRISCRK